MQSASQFQLRYSAVCAYLVRIEVLLKFTGPAISHRPDVRHLRMESLSSGFANAMVSAEHDDLVACVQKFIDLNCQTRKLEPDSSENSFDHLIQATIRAAIRQGRILSCNPLDRRVKQLKHSRNVSRCKLRIDFVDDLYVQF